MRAVLVGAVESSLVALNALAAAPDWELAGVCSLPPDRSGRHSDYVDLSGPARAAGAEFIETPNINSPDAIARIKALEPDHLFVIGWSQIFGEALLGITPDRTIGYHPAPLPRMRGRAAIPWTILMDEPISAGTLFWVDAGTDSGDILDQHYFHLAHDETAASLYAKHMHALDVIMRRTLQQIAQGSARREKQDESYATWATRRTPADGLIDWSKKAAEIDRLIRAVGPPYPGAQSKCGEETFTILGGRVMEEGRRYVASTGQVIQTGADRFAVMCGDGLAIEATQWTSASGNPPKIHSMLGRE